jgi:hypothetical protein
MLLNTFAGDLSSPHQARIKNISSEGELTQKSYAIASAEFNGSWIRPKFGATNQQVRIPAPAGRKKEECDQHRETARE